MKKLFTILAILLALTAAYYGVWRYQMSGDVARVKASIDYQNQQFRVHNRWITFKADSVYPSGFPLHSRVRVVRPTLTFVWGDETYGASFSFIELSARDADWGTYELHYPPTIEAVYAKSGQGPEEYKVTAKQSPTVLLRAQADSRQCMGLPGTPRCAAVAADAPLISYAVQLPEKLTISIELNGQSKDENFTMVALDMPIYQTIPDDMDRPLEIFVNMLREAFQKN